MADTPHPWRCRYTEGEHEPEGPCWVASEDGPRLAIDRAGGCLARTDDEARQCAEETGDLRPPRLDVRPGPATGR